MSENPNSNPRRDEGEPRSSDDALRDAPPGSSTLGSSPPTRGPAENPVNRSNRDAGEVLAEEVREGRWDTPAEKRDEERGGTA